MAEKKTSKYSPTVTRVYIKRSLEISEEIKNILKELGMSQKDLADKLEKKESEISKYLSGMHNFTLHTLVKIETVLGQRIFYTKAGIQMYEKGKLIIGHAPKEEKRINVTYSETEHSPKEKQLVPQAC